MGARTERLRLPLPIDRLQHWKGSTVGVLQRNGTTVHGRLLSIDAQQCLVVDALHMAPRNPNNLHSIPTDEVLEISREIIGPF